MCQAISEGGRRCPIHRRDTVVALRVASELCPNLPPETIEGIFTELRREGRHAQVSGLSPTSYEDVITRIGSYIPEGESGDALRNRLAQRNLDDAPDGATLYALRRLLGASRSRDRSLSLLFSEVATETGRTLGDVQERWMALRANVDTSRGAALPEEFTEDAQRHAFDNDLPSDVASVVAFAQLREERVVEEQPRITRASFTERSSAIMEAGYDPEGGRLEIVFRSNPERVYAWHSVPENVWQSINEGTSPTRAFQRLVRGVPEYLYDTQEEEYRDAHRVRCSDCGQFAAAATHVCPNRSSDTPDTVIATDPTDELATNTATPATRSRSESESSSPFPARVLNRSDFRVVERPATEEGGEPTVVGVFSRNSRSRWSGQNTISMVTEETLSQYGVTEAEMATVRHIRPSRHWGETYLPNLAALRSAAGRGTVEVELGRISLNDPLADHSILPRESGTPTLSQSPLARARLRTSDLHIFESNISISGAVSITRDENRILQVTPTRTFRCSCGRFASERDAGRQCIHARVYLASLHAFVNQGGSDTSAEGAIVADSGFSAWSEEETNNLARLRALHILAREHQASGNESEFDMDSAEAQTAADALIAEETAAEALAEEERRERNAQQLREEEARQAAPIAGDAERARSQHERVENERDRGPADHSESEANHADPLASSESAHRARFEANRAAYMAILAAEAQIVHDRLVAEETASEARAEIARRERNAQRLREEEARQATLIAEYAERARSQHERVENERERWLAHRPEFEANRATYLANLAERWREVEPGYGDDTERVRADFEAAQSRRAARQPFLEPILDGAPGAVTDGICDPNIPGSRRFGVEIEFDGATSRSAKEAIIRDMREAGLTQQTHVRGYHGSKGNNWSDWSLERDCSVSGELVTPLLADTPEDWAKMQTMLDILKRHGAKASVRAGAHVNISTSSFLGSSAKNIELVRVMKEYEDVLYRAAADPGRGTHRGGDYCMPNAVTPEVTVHKSDPVRVPGSPLTAYHGHGRMVNISESTQMDEGARTEFRVWDSSLDLATIQQQVAISAALADYAERVVEEREESPGASRAPMPRGTYSIELGETNNVNESALSKVGELADKLFRRHEDRQRFVSLFAVNRWA